MLATGYRALRLAAGSARGSFTRTPLVTASCSRRLPALACYSTAPETRETNAPQESAQLPASDAGKEPPSFLRKSPTTKPLWAKAHPPISIDVDGKSVSFETSFLRESCPCSQCIHPSTKQRNFKVADIPIPISPKSIEKDGDITTIQWQNDIPGFDQHVSKFTTEHLRRLQNPHPQFKEPLVLWDRRTFEIFYRRISYDDYMNTEAGFRASMLQLRRFGLLFLDNVPEDPESVAKIATRIGTIKNTFYGMTWDVRNKPDPKNVAYTNDALGFHMDLLYFKQPPGYQFLHCMKNELPGGESLFSDSFKAADTLRKDHSQYFKHLKRAPVSFGYKNDKQDYMQERKTIEASVDNPEEAQYVNYSPPFQIPNLPPITPRHTDIPHSHTVESLKRFKDILEREDNVVELKLDAGQCVIFQNRRIVHGRRAFAAASGEDSRDRWLRGTYVDEEVAHSQFKSLGIM
ncbi:hypothetical protein FQN49_007695 [Arthroderma sp. PD_2]|nr:hypothetical protein FQN49_007695 [Arthroderma sp. PD_2]